MVRTLRIFFSICNNGAKKIVLQNLMICTRRFLLYRKVSEELPTKIMKRNKEKVWESMKRSWLPSRRMNYPIMKFIISVRGVYTLKVILPMLRVILKFSFMIALHTDMKLWDNLVEVLLVVFSRLLTTKRKNM